MRTQKLTIGHSAETQDLTLWDAFVLPVLKYRRLSYVIIATSVATMIVISLLLKNQYTSTAVVLPSGGRPPASVLSQAVGSLADLGIGTPFSFDDNPAANYMEILSSRWIADRILETPFASYCDPLYDGSTLESYLDVPNRDRAVRRLRTLVRIGTDSRTGATRVSVTTPCAELSAAIAQAYVGALDEWNVNQRRSSAGESMKFIEARLGEKQEELRLAEEELRDFQAMNRDFASTGNPDVMLEHGRLSRKVDVSTRLYLALMNEYQQARLDAARDVPVVQVLDRGSVPHIKSGPRRTMYVLGALFGSVFVSILLSIWLDLSAKKRPFDRIRDLSQSGALHPNRAENRLSGALARVGAGLQRMADVPQAASEEAERPPVERGDPA